jgi:taurine dioxygenase
MAYATETVQIIEPSPGEFGAELRGIDVKQLPAGSPEFAVMRDLIYRHRLIVIRGQELDEAQYVEFARKMGTPQIYFQENYHHPDYPEIFVSSNVKENGRKIGVARTGNYWHTDCSFQEKPLSWTSIYPQIFPKQRRGTMYIDLAKVYRNLPDDLRGYVDGVTAVHAGQLRYKVKESDIDRSLKDLLEWINKEVPPVRHPAVIVHPVTKEKILYLNSGFTVQLEGVSHEENQRRLKALFDFIEREEHIHDHPWDEGDLIIWDNRSLIHMSTTVPQGELSKSYRIGIYDGLPFYEGLQP